MVAGNGLDGVGAVLGIGTETDGMFPAGPTDDVPVDPFGPVIGEGGKEACAVCAFGSMFLSCCLSNCREAAISVNVLAA